jgi:hypothetical protein
MAALNFPSSPVDGQTYTLNGVFYTYSSTKNSWIVTNYANSPIGYTGSLGYTGSQGAGFTGSRGDTGYTGSSGAYAAIGYTGSQGVPGDVTTGKAIAMAIVFG